MDEPYVTFERCKVDYTVLDKKALESPNISRLCFCSLDAFSKILSDGFDIDHLESDRKNINLLHFLVYRCDLDKIKLLLQYHPDISFCNSEGHNVFFLFKEWCFRPDTDNMLVILDGMLNLVESSEILQTYDRYGDNVVIYYQKIIETFTYALEKYHYPLLGYNTFNLDFTQKMILRFENHISKTKTLFSLMLSEIE